MATFRFKTVETTKGEKNYVAIQIAGKTIPSNMIIPAKVAKKLVKKEEDRARFNPDTVYRMRGSVYEKNGERRTAIWLNSLDRTRSFMISKGDDYTYDEIRELIELSDKYWNAYRERVNKQQNEQES